MSRTIERSIARREYEKFARRWREEKRFAGVYGKTGYRKPSFNEWYHMHQSDLEQMRQSSPADVQEHLGLDPWIEVQPERPLQQVHTDLSSLQQVHDETEERGVITIDIASGEEERDG